MPTGRVSGLRGRRRSRCKTGVRCGDRPTVAERPRAGGFGPGRGRLQRIAHLHLLPEGSFLPPPPEGYVTRQRTEVGGVDLATLDAEVEQAGGWVDRR